MLHPGRFGHVMAFSTGMPPDGRTRWDPTNGPVAHLCAGTLEDGFHSATLMWSYFLERIGATHHLTERVCGHDLIQWCEELPNALQQAFGTNS
jgi:enterochelin esterase-like enzyme